MPSPIDVLPAELFTEVTRYLRHHDLTSFIRVSRQYQRFLEPILWQKVELHRLSYHEDYAYMQLCEEEAAAQRPYQQPKAIPTLEGAGHASYAMERYYDEKATVFLDVVSKETVADRERARHLASLVRWLCLTVNGSNAMTGDSDGKLDHWNALAMLPNLEYLEITAQWRSPESSIPFIECERPMLKLKTLKLRGYFPTEFVQYACAHPASITELQLGVLDVPIGSTLQSERENPPPPADPMDEDAEDFDGIEVVAPRPLACLTPEIISGFTALASLSLCKPCEAREDPDNTYLGIYHSIRSEERILSEWASLIRANRKTLTHLTLDQRLICSEIELDGTTNEEYMEEAVCGPGYERFVKLVLPALLEDAEWPVLMAIRLFGFKVADLKEHEVSVDVAAQLADRFRESVEVSDRRGRRIPIHDESGEVCEGGDVLDSADSFGDGDGDEDDHLFWHCRPGSAWGDSKFGRVPRLA